MSESVHYRVEGGVAVITLDNPAKKNAITPTMSRTVSRRCAEAAADPGVGAIVVSSTSDSFCSGADTSSLATVADDPLGSENFEAIEDIYAGFLDLENSALPTIAAVRGVAVGAGVNLAFAADVRIVSPTSRFISGFTRKGLHPGGGHLDLIARATSPELSSIMAIFGVEVSGEDLHRLGGAWRCVQDDRVESVAIELGHRVAGNPELARATKRTLRETVQARSSRFSAVKTERVEQLRTMRILGGRIADRPR